MVFLRACFLVHKSLAEPEGMAFRQQRGYCTNSPTFLMLMHGVLKSSWRFVNAHDLAGVCRRKLLLEVFGEEIANPAVSGDCCDVRV